MLWLDVQGQKITCEKRGEDRYGCIIAVCHAGGVGLSWNMVKLGWVLAYRRYSSDYVEAEAQAKKLRSGLWKWRFTPPWKWRAMMKKPLNDPDTLPGKN